MSEHNKSQDVTTDEADKHAPSDTVHLPRGYKVTLPGGIYTFIFLVLGALTLFELAIAELTPPELDTFILPILLVASLLKAVLVVTFYMHLNTDSIFYRFVLIVPVGIVLVATLYLIVVPPVAYNLP
jgi:caa(3)-type oxidase subunit IV